MSKVERSKQRIGSSRVNDLDFASSNILPAKLPARVAANMHMSNTLAKPIILLITGNYLCAATYQSTDMISL